MKARMEDRGRGKVEAATSPARKMHRKEAVDISVAITGQRVAITGQIVLFLWHFF